MEIFRFEISESQMIIIMRRCLFVIAVSIMISCGKDKEIEIVDNSVLVGKWQVRSVNYYKLENNTLIPYNLMSGLGQGDSVVYLANGTGESFSWFYGRGEFLYSYIPAKKLLRQRFGNYLRIDTVRALTPNLCVTVRPHTDTLYFPLTIVHFLRIDSLER